MSIPLYQLASTTPGEYQFTMPSGFSSNVEVHLWGAGGGSGLGVAGGGGGYAKSYVNITSGDIVRLAIGSAGKNAILNNPSLGGNAFVSTGLGFDGGGAAVNTAGDDAHEGPGGGGGGATALLVNGNVQVVAAGGGGGAGGRGYQQGLAGKPGGVTTVTSTSTVGGSSARSYATGGGGGGGYPKGGAAGASVGDDAGAPGPGNGGQNYGNLTIAGSGILSGGKYTTYNSSSVGNAGNPGYAVFVFTRSMQIYNKQGGAWSSVANVFYKTADQYITTSLPGAGTVSKTYDTGTSTLTIPARVSSVAFTALGGGGGAGTSSGASSYAGSGGQQISGSLTVTPGQVLTMYIGAGGKSNFGTSAGNGEGGIDPSGKFSGNTGSGFAGGSGSGTSIKIGTSTTVVAAGGNGGIGYTTDAAWHPVGPVGAWSTFLNTYAVWGGTMPLTRVINFPTTGTYTFNYSVDNYGTFSIDGVAVITRTGEHNYENMYTATRTVTAGNHTITVYGYDMGGAYGIGAQILNPDTTELWNTRQLVTTDSAAVGGGVGSAIVPAGASTGTGSNGGLSGKVTLTYTQDPETILVNAGGWKPVNQVYIKDNNVWKPVVSTNTIALGSIPIATYSLSGNVSTLTEGVGGSNAIAFTFTTTGSDGTYYYDSPGTVVDATFLDGTMDGTFSVSGGTGTITKLVPLRLTYQRPLTNTFNLQARVGSAAGTVKAISQLITINYPTNSLNSSNVFSTVGTTTWTVPNGVYRLEIIYPTPRSGNVSITNHLVKPGDTVSITVGDYGQNSTVTSTFNTVTIPGYNTPVFSYNGNIDNDVWNYVQVAKASLTSYTAAGYNAAQIAGAAAAGISYNVVGEGWHGDLYSSISINPVLTASIVNNIRVALSSGSGRAYPGSHSFPQQPTAANGYIMHDYQGDYSSSEGGFGWVTNLQQQGYVKITY